MRNIFLDSERSPGKSLHSAHFKSFSQGSVGPSSLAARMHCSGFLIGKARMKQQSRMLDVPQFVAEERNLQLSQVSKENETAALKHTNSVFFLFMA